MRTKEGNIPRGEIKFNSGRTMKTSKTNHLKNNKAMALLGKPSKKSFESANSKKLLRSQDKNSKKMIEM